MKTELSSTKAKYVGDGINEKDVQSFYTSSVSSFKPNALSPEEFENLYPRTQGLGAISIGVTLTKSFIFGTSFTMSLW